MNTYSFIGKSGATAFLFPGQGSQEVGMGHALAEKYPSAAAAFQEADDVLGIELSRLCFAGPEETLTDTINAQPALLATSVATLRAIESELDGRIPAAADGPSSYVAGHSMGEYTALVAVGSLAYADALRLVRERGRLMQKAGQTAPGLMAAILGMEESRVAEVCAEVTVGSRLAQVANDNCPGQVVISGNQEGMEAAMEALRKAGARKVVPLAVSIAAHSPLMAPVAAELGEVIDATPLNAAKTPLIANTSAEPIQTVDAIRAELKAQLTGSVRWTASMGCAIDAGINRFVEIGPGNVLASLVKRVQRKSERLTVNDPDGVAALVAVLLEA